MDLTECTGGDTSSGNARKRAELSHIRALIGPAIKEGRAIIIKWRDDRDALQRESVVPMLWKGRTKLTTKCGEVIELAKIEEVTQ